MKSYARNIFFNFSFSVKRLLWICEAKSIDLLNLTYYCHIKNIFCLKNFPFAFTELGACFGNSIIFIVMIDTWKNCNINLWWAWMVVGGIFSQISNCICPYGLMYLSKLLNLWRADGSVKELGWLGWPWDEAGLNRQQEEWTSAASFILGGRLHGRDAL